MNDQSFDSIMPGPTPTFPRRNIFEGMKFALPPSYNTKHFQIDARFTSSVQGQYHWSLDGVRPIIDPSLTGDNALVNCMFNLYEKVASRLDEACRSLAGASQNNCDWKVISNVWCAANQMITAGFAPTLNSLGYTIGTSGKDTLYNQEQAAELIPHYNQNLDSYVPTPLTATVSAEATRTTQAATSQILPWIRGYLSSLPSLSNPLLLGIPAHGGEDWGMQGPSAGPSDVQSSFMPEDAHWPSMTPALTNVPTSENLPSCFGKRSTVPSRRHNRFTTIARIISDPDNTFNWVVETEWPTVPLNLNALVQKMENDYESVSGSFATGVQHIVNGGHKPDWEVITPHWEQAVREIGTRYLPILRERGFMMVFQKHEANMLESGKLSTWSSSDGYELPLHIKTDSPSTATTRQVLSAFITQMSKAAVK